MGGGQIVYVFPFSGYGRSPKGWSRKMLPPFLHFNGVVCSNTLYSNTSAFTNSGNSTRKGSRTPRLVEHFWVPILGASCSNKFLFGPLWPSHCRTTKKILGNLFSGKKKEPKPKLIGPDIFGWGRGLPREGVGAEKFGMSLQTRETKHFWRDIPGVPEKFEKKR